MEEHVSPSEVAMLGSTNDGGQSFSFTSGAPLEAHAIFEFSARSPEVQSAAKMDAVLRERARMERYRKILKEEAAELRREQRERLARSARVVRADQSLLSTVCTRTQEEMAEEEEREERRGLQARSRHRDCLAWTCKVVRDSSVKRALMQFNVNFNVNWATCKVERVAAREKQDKADRDVLVRFEGLGQMARRANMRRILLQLAVNCDEEGERTMEQMKMMDGMTFRARMSLNAHTLLTCLKTCYRQGVFSDGEMGHKVLQLNALCPGMDLSWVNGAVQGRQTAKAVLRVMGSSIAQVRCRANMRRTLLQLAVNCSAGRERLAEQKNAEELRRRRAKRVHEVDALFKHVQNSYRELRLVMEGRISDGEMKMRVLKLNTIFPGMDLGWANGAIQKRGAARVDMRAMRCALERALSGWSMRRVVLQLHANCTAARMRLMERTVSGGKPREASNAAQTGLNMRRALLHLAVNSGAGRERKGTTGHQGVITLKVSIMDVGSARTDAADWGEKAPSALRSSAAQQAAEMGERRVSNGQRRLEIKKREKEKAEQGKMCEQRGIIEMNEMNEQKLMIEMNEIDEQKGLNVDETAPAALCRGAARVLGQHIRAERWLRMRLRRSRSGTEVWEHMMKSWIR
jgi:hypothetical protein